MRDGATDVFNFVACLAEAEPSFSIGFVRNVRRGIHEGAYLGAQNLCVNAPCNGFYPLFCSRRMLMNPNNLIVAHLDAAIVSC